VATSRTQGYVIRRIGEMLHARFVKIGYRVITRLLMKEIVKRRGY
jgi:hypothetical protein